MIICLMSTFLVAFSCKTSHKEVIVTKSGEIVLSPKSDVFELGSNNFFGTYIGKIPCSCCKNGVKTVLTLKEDSSYRLKEDRNHHSKVINGFYSVENNIITLDDKDIFRLNKNQLYFLQSKAHNQDNSTTYILNKVK